VLRLNQTNPSEYTCFKEEGGRKLVVDINTGTWTFKQIDSQEFSTLMQNPEKEGVDTLGHLKHLVEALFNL
jgi:hypothetical protein